MHVLLALLAVQQPVPPPASPVSDTAHVVIVATTDVHGRVLGWDYVRDAAAPGGLSRAATMVETLRAQSPEQVVLVDAGDLIEGNLFAAYFAERDSQRPHPVVDALNAMQYDAATPGNHEFDFGTAVLARATGDATYHYVSANIFKGASDTLVYPPHVVVTRSGVKIGITGFTTPGVMVWDRSELGGRMRVRPIAEAAPPAMRRLDLTGVDLKVVLIHSGLNEPSSYDTAGVGAENAALGLASIPLPAPRPDLVIVGHSHKEMRDYVVNGVHFVQPRNFALSLAVVHVSLVKEAGTYRVVSMRPELMPLATVAEQPRFVRRFTAAHERARAWAATPLGTAGPGFSARYGRVEDTPLLDFINEVQRRRAGADLSAAADFDLGAGLPEGELRERDVSGIYPYVNTLRAVRISGDQLKAYLEQAARYFRSYEPGPSLINDSVPGFNFDIVSAVTYTIDLTQWPGRRIRGRRAPARQHAAPGVGDQRLPRRARAAGVALVRGAPGRRGGGTQAVARQPRAGMLLHEHPARRRRRNAGDAGLQLQFRTAGDRRAERARDRRGGHRQPRVRLVGRHAARPDGRGALPLPGGEHHRFRGHRPAGLGRAVHGDRAWRRARGGDRARPTGDARDHGAAERPGARLRRRRAGGAPRAAAGPRRGRLRDRRGARGRVLRRRRRGGGPRGRRPSPPEHRPCTEARLGLPGPDRARPHPPPRPHRRERDYAHASALCRGPDR